MPQPDPGPDAMHSKIWAPQSGRFRLPTLTHWVPECEGARVRDRAHRCKTFVCLHLRNSFDNARADSRANEQFLSCCCQLKIRLKVHFSKAAAVVPTELIKVLKFLLKLTNCNQFFIFLFSFIFFLLKFELRNFNCCWDFNVNQWVCFWGSWYCFVFWVKICAEVYLTLLSFVLI